MGGTEPLTDANVTAPTTPTVVSGGKPVVLTEAQTRTALAKAAAKRAKVNRIQQRIANTNRVDDILSGQVDLASTTRGAKENLALLLDALDTVTATAWKPFLYVLDTFDIHRLIRVIRGRVPALDAADRTIRRDLVKFEVTENSRLAGELEQIAKFLQRFPKAMRVLSDLEFATTAFQVDPTKAKTAEEYAAKIDKKTAELRKELAAEKDAGKRATIERKISTRLSEIVSVYDGVPGEDSRVFGWRDLSRPEFGGNKGKEIFKIIRDGHRRDLEARYQGLRSRLMETKEGDSLAAALEKLETQFKPALDQVIYFPAMRFGSFYARVGVGDDSIFKMFESRFERNRFVRLMRERGEEVTETGNVNDLRSKLGDTGSPLKDVLDLFGNDPKDISALESEVFDLWLQSMTAGDMRKHMAPRKMRAGYSTNIVKNYAKFRRSSISAQKKALFGDKLRTEFARAKEFVAPQPDKEKMDVFINELEIRALARLNPPYEDSYLDKAIQLGNKAAFLQYLANPGTAAIQLSQLHVVALPILAQKYGHVGANLMLAKYGFASLGGLAVTTGASAIPTKDEYGSWDFSWKQPNLLDNPISTLKQERDPEMYEVLSEGWQEASDLDMFLDTFANAVGNYGRLDPNQRSAIQELARGRLDIASIRGAAFTFEAMGAFFHQMERTNREATYMAALELAYRQGRKDNKSHQQAKKDAIEDAINTTLEAAFDFSSYNKPRILSSRVGRMGGQFFSYPYFMNSLLARKMYVSIFGGLQKGDRQAALEIATGTLVNLSLYAGVVGIPVFGAISGIVTAFNAAKEAFAGDDDEEEGGLSYIDEDGNIRATYNFEWWFRNVFIPRHFGADGTVANLFGLTPETAETVALSIEKGPISAITDVDLANKVALEFLFFLPEEPRAKDAKGMLGEYALGAMTGAAGGVAMDYAQALEDVMGGYEKRALEKLPKLYGNLFKALRFGEEGQLNQYSREVVGMEADFWTDEKVIIQALGFSSTKASQRVKQVYEGRRIKADVAAKRNKVLEEYRKVALDSYQYGDTPEVITAKDKVFDNIRKFNNKYPTDLIDADTLYRSHINAVEKAQISRSTGGIPIDLKKGRTPYLGDLYGRNFPSEDVE